MERPKYIRDGIQEGLFGKVMRSLRLPPYFRTYQDQSPKYESLETEAGEMIRRANNLGIDVQKIFKITNMYLDNAELRHEGK